MTASVRFVLAVDVAKQIADELTRAGEGDDAHRDQRHLLKQHRIAPVCVTGHLLGLGGKVKGIGLRGDHFGDFVDYAAILSTKIRRCQKLFYHRAFTLG